MVLALSTLSNPPHNALALDTSRMTGSSNTSSVVSVEQQNRTPLSFAENKKIQMLKTVRKSIVSVIGANSQDSLDNYLDLLSVNASLSNITTPMLATKLSATLTQGTGFVLDTSGIIMTNKHVVEDATLYYGVIDDMGTIYKVENIQKDPLNDIAILRISFPTQKTLPSLTFASIAEYAQVGQSSFALGNVLGKYANSINEGIVSGLRRTLTAYGEDNVSERLFDMIQTDASINQGDSGGPLLDSNGKILGMNTAFDPQGESIGFAIHSKYLLSVYKSYLKYGYIPRPFLGVQYTKLNKEGAKALGLSSTYGAYINADTGSEAVVSNSPAAKAGFQKGDIIVSVAGLEIKGDRTLSDVLSLYRQEEKVKFKVKRGSKDLYIEAKLENHKE